MMDRQLDRDNDRLRVLIETMQRAGKPERDIETAIRKASGGLHRDTSRPSRRLIRFALPRRASNQATASR
jgi:hypothetical protein